MQLLFIIAALVLFTAGAIVNYSVTSSQKESKKNILNVLSASTSPTPTKTIIFSTGIPSPTIIPTKEIPTTTKSPTPAITLTQSDQSFLYPNLQNKTVTSSSIWFDSIDSPEQIRTWYQQQIKNKHMNATSFVNTVTNGNTLISLSASSGTESVSVTISRSSNELISHVEIKM